VFLAIGNKDQVKQITGNDQQIVLSDPQQLNSYSYSENNPIIKSDPSGNISLVPPQVQVLQKALTGMQQWFSTFSNRPAISNGTNQTKEALQINQKENDQMMSLAMGFIAPDEGMASSITPEAVEKIIQGTGAEVRNNLMKYAQNEKLGNIIKNLFQDTDRLSGGTAGAIEHTANTGEMVGDSNHIIKGRESLNGLNKVLNNPAISQNDYHVANGLVNQIINALKKVK